MLLTLNQSQWVYLSKEAATLLPVGGFSPSRKQIFSQIIACPSNLCLEDVDAIWSMITFNGGTVKIRLDKTCTHLITFKTEGAKYQKAQDVSSSSLSSLKIVTPDWIMDAVKNQKLPDEDLYHPNLLIDPNAIPPVVVPPVVSIPPDVTRPSGNIATPQVMMRSQVPNVANPQRQIRVMMPNQIQQQQQRMQHMQHQQRQPGQIRYQQQTQRQPVPSSPNLVVQNQSASYPGPMDPNQQQHMQQQQQQWSGQQQMQHGPRGPIQMNYGNQDPNQIRGQQQMQQGQHPRQVYLSLQQQPGIRQQQVNYGPQAVRHPQQQQMQQQHFQQQQQPQQQPNQYPNQQQNPQTQQIQQQQSPNPQMVPKPQNVVLQSRIQPPVHITVGQMVQQNQQQQPLQQNPTQQQQQQQMAGQPMITQQQGSTGGQMGSPVGRMPGPNPQMMMRGQPDPSLRFRPPPVGGQPQPPQGPHGMVS